MGIDVSFDVFYCLGIIALSLVMYREPNFGRFLGGFGVISAAALLIFNLATFPYVLAQPGLVDLGPLTGVWWVLVFIRMKRTVARVAREASTGSGAA